MPVRWPPPAVIIQADGDQVAVSGTSLNIDKSNFLDNRSGPIETVSSFLNALNLKQYVRAYYYYQNPSTYPGPFDPYAAGYSNTDVITATFGNVQSEGAAGSMYFKVPLAMKVLTTSNTIQTFVGCYTLRLAQPSDTGHSALPTHGHSCWKIQAGGEQYRCCPAIVNCMQLANEKRKSKSRCNQEVL